MDLNKPPPKLEVEGHHAEPLSEVDEKRESRMHTKRELWRKDMVVKRKRNWRPSGLLEEYFYSGRQKVKNPVQPSAPVLDLNNYPSDLAGQGLFSCKTEKPKLEDLFASTSRVVSQRKPPETVSSHPMHEKEPAWSCSTDADAPAPEFSSPVPEYVAYPKQPQSAQWEFWS